ncbi:hypothetical protein LWI29_033284 [Acer saccharum]|uniref:Retrotransposon gag domain-containing protein n=1 Tax=Acer saccharum TaxID=4024 RepID=A0AA39VZP0_ACESA|nr:hypothetical protein LWI29_033284 [Acer saccharum]
MTVVGDVLELMKETAFSHLMEMVLIWEELGAKFRELFEMGRAGVIAALIAANQRLHTHEHKCGTAKEVWDVVKRSYLDASDYSQVYELMKKTFQLRHDGRPLKEYYNELNSVFMELDYRRPNDKECTVNSEKYMKRISEDRVYMFLAGLDHNLDQVTMGTEDRSEASALAVKKGNFQPTPHTSPLTRLYTHCNSITHMVNTCWKKHSYPEWYKLKQAERKSNRKPPHVALTEASPSSGSHVSRVSHHEGNSSLVAVRDLDRFQHRNLPTTSCATASVVDKPVVAVHLNTWTATTLPTPIPGIDQLRSSSKSQLMVFPLPVFDPGGNGSIEEGARKAAENAIHVCRVDEQVNKAVLGANGASTAARVAAVKVVQNRVDGKFCDTVIQMSRMTALGESVNSY